MRGNVTLAAVTLAACGVSKPTAITITTDIAPGLVAFREGATGPWQAATMKSATTFEANVHGPYVLAVQCADVNTVVQQTTYSTLELAQTPDDPHDVTLTCGVTYRTMFWNVTGQMVQAGKVYSEIFPDMSTTPNWSYAFFTDPGTWDLMAITATDIAFRRALDIHADLVVAPAIDMTQEGTPLVATAFSVTNAAANESLFADVDINNATMSYAQVYGGPLATAMVAPDSVLTAGDQQSASMQATVGINTRALRRPFHAGDNAEYTLPPQSDLALSFQSGQLVATWTTLLPDFDLFDVYASAFTTMTNTNFDLEMTPAFEAATHATQLVLDTNIPGYNAAQGIDFMGSFEGSAVVQRVANDVVETTSSGEMFGPSVTDRTAVRTARLRARRP